MLVVLCYPSGDYYYCYDEDCANRIGHIAIEPHDFAAVYAPYFFSVNDDQRYVNVTGRISVLILLIPLWMLYCSGMAATLMRMVSVVTRAVV